MAKSTAGTYLYYKPTEMGEAELLCPITSFPDTGSTPNKIDTTDLSQLKYKTNILGLMEVPDLEFEANYDKATFDKIYALNDVYTFELRYGLEAADGGATWKGKVIIYHMGGGVDEARKMKIVCSAQEGIQPLMGA